MTARAGWRDHRCDISCIKCFETEIRTENETSKYGPAPQSLKSFCLIDRGRLGNEGWPILLKIGTQSSYVELCNLPKFQLPRPFFSPVLDINPSGVHRG